MPVTRQNQEADDVFIWNPCHHLLTNRRVLTDGPVGRNANKLRIVVVLVKYLEHENSVISSVDEFITGNLLECELERNSCGLVFQNLMLWPLSWSKDNVLDQFFQPRPFHLFHRPSTQVPWFRWDLITKWIRFKDNWVNEKRLCRSVANYLFHIPDWMIISLELLPSREYVSERFLSASSADRVKMGVPRLLFSGTDLR